MQPWIDKAVRIIIELYAPERIILFGSCAKGEQNAHSDVDLLIVKETNVPRAYRGLDVVEYMRRYPVKYDLLFYTPRELADGVSIPYSFLDTIMRRSKILYIRSIDS